MKKAAIFLTLMATVALLISCGSDSSSDDMDIDTSEKSNKSLTTETKTVDFSKKYKTTSKDFNITLTNDGDVDLSNIAIVSSETVFTTSSTTTTIKKSENKIIKITFSPTDAITYNGTIEFKDANDLLLSINLTGTGTNTVSFNNDVLPLIESKCSGCHTGGANTNFTIYNNAKSNINEIISRINKTEDSNDFMPKSGNKLSTTELNLFQKWLDDGTLEND